MADYDAALNLTGTVPQIPEEPAAEVPAAPLPTNAIPGVDANISRLLSISQSGVDAKDYVKMLPEMVSTIQQTGEAQRNAYQLQINTENEKIHKTEMERYRLINNIELAPFPKRKPYAPLPSPNIFKNPDGSSNKAAIIAASALAVLSIGGTSFARSGSVEAMESLNAALTGFMQGHEKMFKYEMEQYQIKMDQIEKEYEDSIKERNAIVEKWKGNLQMTMHDLSLFYQRKGLLENRMLSSFKDEQTMLLHLFNGLLAVQGRRLTAKETRKTTQDDVIIEEQNKLLKEFKNKTGREPNSAERIAMRGLVIKHFALAKDTKTEKKGIADILAEEEGTKKLTFKEEVEEMFRTIKTGGSLDPWISIGSGGNQKAPAGAPKVEPDGVVRGVSKRFSGDGNTGDVNTGARK